MIGFFSQNGKKLWLIFVLANTGLAYAGSFEDYFDAVKQDNAAKVNQLLVKGNATILAELIKLV